MRMKLTCSAAVSRTLAFALFTGSATLLPAITVSLGPDSAPGITTSHEWQSDYVSWVIADLSDPVAPAPVEVAASAAAGSWVLDLTFPAAFPELQTGDTFQIQELLALIAPGEALSGWSQTINTPGWEWTDGAVFDDAAAAPVPGLLTGISGPTLTYSFDPLTPGTALFVANTLSYTGPGGPAAPLQLRLAAVPEPGSSILGLLTGALWLGRRTRGGKH